MEFCRNNLVELKELAQQLDHSQYIKKLDVLHGATMGQHIRHILEFYRCFFDGMACGEVNYDNRQRNTLWEYDTEAVLDAIECLMMESKLLKPTLLTKNIVLVCKLNTHNEEERRIFTTVEREALYCYEHSIHHQALLKTALYELKLLHLCKPEFGVAPSTLKNLKAIINQ